MKSFRDDRLDRFLEDWADQGAASAEDLTCLRQRIDEQLEEDNAVAVDYPLPSAATGRFVTAGLAAAAVLVVALGVWRSPVRQQTPENRLQLAVTDAYGSAGSFQAYWPKHMQRQGRLLTEHCEVFGQRVAWVTETEKSCNVGLAPAGASGSVPSEYVVVQLWLVARNQQDGQSEVHSISVLVGREELVELPAAGGGQLVLWAHPVDDKMISIDLRYQPDSAVGIKIDDSNLQRIGQVTNIYSFEQDGIEYKLYQSADLIHHKLG